jgi:hypothetical protein
VIHLAPPLFFSAWLVLGFSSFSSFVVAAAAVTYYRQVASALGLAWVIAAFSASVAVPGVEICSSLRSSIDHVKRTSTPCSPYFPSLSGDSRDPRDGHVTD